MEGIANTIIKTGAFFVKADEVLTFIKKIPFHALGLATLFNTEPSISGSIIPSFYEFDV